MSISTPSVTTETPPPDRSGKGAGIQGRRFLRTTLELQQWAYARAYHNSDQRSAELLNWLHRYNWHWPHGSLKANTPISRLALAEDHLLRPPILVNRI